MALIGPRPHALAHDELYSQYLPHYWSRFSVRPGLTGLAQVDGFRGEVHELDCMRKRIEADLRYVREWSLKLDFIILLRTLPLLIVDRKAY
jgi:putative colanic acid biosynthesis UDP-glucose lipid carrier transferase